MHANTAEVPISWELIEPTEGNFDFHTVDDVVNGARAALKSAWAATQFRASGDWQQVFGDVAPDAFSAW